MKKGRSQAETVQNMSDRDLILNLYFTQFLLALAAGVLGWFLFRNWHTFLELFRWQPIQILVFGGMLASAVILADLCLTKGLPEGQYDDGGINERLFSTLSVPHAFFATMVIAFVEEILFRGVLQVHFGLIAASIVFALLHIRYLRKMVLFAVTVGISFLLGLVFWYTQNLLVTIFAHFAIDFILGVTIRVQNRGSRQANKEEEAGWMGRADENYDFQPEEKELSSLPPRAEYHQRLKSKEKSAKKKVRNQFLLARILLVAFIVLVVAALMFSISNFS